MAETTISIGIRSVSEEKDDSYRSNTLGTATQPQAL